MRRLAVAALLVLGRAGPAGTAEVLLGVLEEPQCQEHPARAVRPLFLRTTDGWIPLSSEKASERAQLDGIGWTIAFDGRSLGSVSSVDPGFTTHHAWTFPRDRLLTVAAGGAPPSIANPDARFAGWCSAPKRRPLVLVSRPNFRDPEGWKPFEPAPALRASLFEVLKAQAGAASSCPPDADKPMVLPYEAKDLVFAKSYEDGAGRKLVALGLDPRRNSCDGPSESAWATHWFLLHAGAHYLGADLSLVDAGDYDADGQSEVLFWYSGYNEDGYTLFYDAFRKSVKFHWKYH